ncbi:MAG: toxin-antitoxin system HicB family antitoxin [Actinomycetota bacterium]
MPRIHYEIPDELHRRAKAEAALQGVTLRDFLIKALELAVANGTHTNSKRKAR